MDYTPRFSWEIPNRGEAIISDHGAVIAQFSTEPRPDYWWALELTSPEHDFRLRNLVLYPGGPPLVADVPGYWTISVNEETSLTAQLVDVRVDRSNPERLEITFCGRDPAGYLQSQKTLTLTYDPVNHQYLWRFDCRLVVPEGHRMALQPEDGFEYLDVFFPEVPAPSLPFPGMWKCPWDRFLFESAAGAVKTAPFNHTSGSSKQGKIQLKRDGVFGPFDGPAGNPVLRPVGPMAGGSRLSICPWGYDVHLYVPFENSSWERTVQGPAELEAAFDIFRCPEEKSREMLAAAERPVIPEEEKSRFVQVPVFLARNDFTRSFDPEACNQDIDPYEWHCGREVSIPVDDGGEMPEFEWEKKGGVEGGGQLIIQSEEPAAGSWSFSLLGPFFFGPLWRRSTKLRLSARVKTKNLTGEGAFLAIGWRDLEGTLYAAHCALSEKLRGSNGWTELSVEIRNKPDRAYSARIGLEFVGAGVACFSDVRFAQEPMLSRPSLST